MIYYSLVARYEDRYNIDEMVSKCANKQKEYCKRLVKYNLRKKVCSYCGYEVCVLSCNNLVSKQLNYQ